MSGLVSETILEGGGTVRTALIVSDKPRQVADAIEEADMTGEQYRALVDRVAVRFKQAELAARLPELQDAIAKIEAQLAKEKAAALEFEHKCRERMGRLNDDKWRLMAQLGGAEKASIDLQNGCDDPELRLYRSRASSSACRVGERRHLPARPTRREGATRPLAGGPPPPRCRRRPAPVPAPARSMEAFRLGRSR